MIYIREMPCWGFGNRLIYYNNLRQMAVKLSDDWSCCPWEGYQHFDGDLLNFSQVKDEVWVHNLELKPCLGENFFQINHVPTRSILRLKNKPEIPEGTCAIHFRGKDFHSWNIEAVLPPEYYYNSIEEVMGECSSFVLFTDDLSLPSFNNVKSLLKQTKTPFRIGAQSGTERYGNTYIDDFAEMSECDYIISSPSTFCISAGFVGKNKKIIHSHAWVKSRTELNDTFWKDLLHGGNKDYSIWKLV
tara:strand:- start:11 stop:745 length:735 start_codon:yes stop_codon:yes gene_type:complete